MLTLFAMVLLYFLPSILAHNKAKFLPIFLVNFFLGWTVIGWFACLVWALAEPERAAYVVAAPRYCCSCGAPTPAAHCPHCGRAWA